jgi:hypothetical protein
MDTRKALDIKQALVTLADALGMTAQGVAANVCLLDQKKFDILLKANRIWNAFEGADIETRGAMLGLEITVESPSAESPE